MYREPGRAVPVELYAVLVRRVFIRYIAQIEHRSGAGWESAGGSSVGGRKTNVKAGRGGLLFYIGEREARKGGHGGAERIELFSKALESVSEGLSLAGQSQQSGCGGGGAGGTASCHGGSGVGGCGGGSGGGGSGCSGGG
jgi:hypothetical protein